MQKLYLIDGSGFIFRAYHALPPLTSPSKVPVGALYGFCNMLIKFIKITNQDELAVIFDAGRVTFRSEIYAAYKAHRPPPPEDLIPQFALVREACKVFGVPSIEAEGFEADDLIATYAQLAKEQGREVIIVSSDKDLMQLVGNGISMFDPIKNKPIHAPEVMEKFGVGPEKVIDIQALAGDSVDNVPGVPGVGVKTAAELVRTYGSLEGVYENLDKIRQPKRREKLHDNKENAFISKQLVTLKNDIKVEHPLESLKISPIDIENARGFFREYGFNTLIQRLPTGAHDPASKDQSVPTAAAERKQNYLCVQDEDTLQRLIRDIENHGIVAVDTETTSLHIHNAKLVGISLATDEWAAYIPLFHRREENLLSNTTPIQQLSLEIVKPYLARIFLNEGIIKIAHNLKYDLNILRKSGLSVKGYDDTLLLSYVLNGGQHPHNMDFLAGHYLGHTTTKYEDVAGKGKKQITFDLVDIEKATHYAAEDARITYDLWAKFKPQLAQKKLATMYERVERHLPEAIAEMEWAGVHVCKAELDKLGIQFLEQMRNVEALIFQDVGETFNLASPKQLGEILFEKMKLPAPKKTKTGAYVTDADAMEKLVKDGHSIAEKVLEWRGYQKLISTYIEGLKAAINPHTNRVHTSYALSSTSTGRLSSSDPNLQNIPIRTENGRKIRHVFRADVGNQLVSLDYSQIELRLLAHIADVAPLIAAFKNGDDIHTRTASEVFKIPLSEIDSLTRRKAKAVNFGIIYGISAFGLSQQIDTSTSEAKEIINAYFETYPGIQDYMEAYKNFAREHGYVKTLMGRHCYTAGISDKNPSIRQFAERQAINAPLQGTNADMIKKAMVAIHHELKAYKTKMLLQVHDELVFEMPTDEIDVLTPKIKRIMEGVIHLKVPVKADIGIADNWGEMK